MEFIDLKTQYQRIQPQIQKRFDAIFSHGKFILGPEVFELEEALASLVRAKHCITVASGTDALQLALMALDINEGDEVIVPAFSFFATAETIALLKAKPVFVDIDPSTYNLDSKQLQKAITDKTKAIIPVDLFGQCADYDAIAAAIGARKIAIIEDGAQSFGAMYKQRPACNLGVISCTSFFPSKPLGCYGDGGACFTDNDELAEKIRCIANHGQTKRYLHTRIGINSRLDTLQAAVLLEKLTIFPEEINLRQQVANNYQRLLQEANISAPTIASFNTSVYAQYTIQVKNRSSVQKQFEESSIPSAIHYPRPLHLQPVFATNTAIKNQLLFSEQASETVLSLPMHPYLTLSQQQAIVNVLKKTQNVTAEAPIAVMA